MAAARLGRPLCELTGIVCSKPGAARAKWSLSPLIHAAVFAVTVASSAGLINSKRALLLLPPPPPPPPLQCARISMLLCDGTPAAH